MDAADQLSRLASCHFPLYRDDVALLSRSGYPDHGWFIREAKSIQYLWRNRISNYHFSAVGLPFH